MVVGGTGLRVGILGPIEVSRDGEPIVLAGEKLPVALAVLASAAGRPVGGGTLADRIWPDRLPERVRGSLQTLIMRLRRALGPDAIARVGDGYRLDVDPDDVDLLRFRRLVGEAAATYHPGTARELLGQALGLWRGEPLTGIRSPSLDRDEIPGLIEERLAALHRRIELDLAAGRHDAVTAELRELTGRYPLRESLWRQLIVALIAAGRPAEAIQAYHAVRARLAEELGIDPSAALQSLYRGLLRGDAPHTEIATAGAAPPSVVGPGRSELEPAGGADPAAVTGARIDGATVNGAAVNGAAVNGAGISGAALNVAGLNGTGLNVAGLNVAGLNGTGFHDTGITDAVDAATGPLGAAPASAAPTGAGPASAAPASAGPATASPANAGPPVAGPRTAGLHTGGLPVAGPHTAGPHTAGPPVADPRTAVPAAAGPATAGPASASPAGPGSTGPGRATSGAGPGPASPAIDSAGPDRPGASPLGTAAPGASAGDANAGDANAGDANAGDANAGDANAGDANAGDANAGDANAGDANAGDANAGDANAGDVTGPGTRPSGAGLPPARRLLGRRREVEALDRWLDSATADGSMPTVAALVGPAGIGKTALAVRWAGRQHDRFPDGRLHLDLRGYGPHPPVPALRALESLLHELRVPAEDIPPGLDERASLLRTVIGARRMVVLLDNARDAAQVRPLLPDPGCLVVVTSRSQLRGLVAYDGAYRVTLGRIRVADARTLLEADAVAGPHGYDNDDVAKVVDRCAGLPLACGSSRNGWRATAATSVPSSPNWTVPTAGSTPCAPATTT